MTGDATGVILQYGAVGALLLLALYAIAQMYKRETQRADKAEANLAAAQAELKAITADMQKTLVGLVEKTTAAISALPREVQK